MQPQTSTEPATYFFKKKLHVVYVCYTLLNTQNNNNFFLETSRRPDGMIQRAGFDPHATS